MDSDEQSDFSDAGKSTARQLPVMSAISRPPEKRSETDVDTIMKSLEYAPVFLPLPPTVRRQLCGSLQALEVKQDDVVVECGAELDFYYVMQGIVKEKGGEEVPQSQESPSDSSDEAEPRRLSHSAGDAFGVPLMECSAIEDRILSTADYVATKPSTLLWLNRDEVLRIAHPNKESTRRVEDHDGDLVALTTYRAVGNQQYQQVVVRASPRKMQEYLLGDEGGPLYIEDFLLTLPVFIKDSEDLMEFLTNCIPEHADKVSSILSIWLRTQNEDFKERPGLQQGLDYIVQELESCPPTPNTRFLQAVSKRLLSDDAMDSLSIYSITSVCKSTSVTSTGSMESNGAIEEEGCGFGMIAESSSPTFSGPLSMSGAGHTAQTVGTATSAMSHGLGNSQDSGSTGSLFRPHQSAAAHRRSARFRRRSQQNNPNRMCGDKIPLRVYNPEGHYRFIPVTDDMPCSQVLVMTLKAFCIDRPVENFTLVNVSVSPPDIVKQRNIQPHQTKLSVYQKTSSRIYLKDLHISGHVTSEETTQEMIRHAEISLHTIDLKELVRRMTMADFQIFKDITPSDYIMDTFEMPSSIASEKRVQDAANLVNTQMMWVVHEVCMEPDVTRRGQVIRIFIELALLFRRVRNFNSMLAIVSGLSYSAVSRLRRSWEKVPRKFVNHLEDMQQILDPSRNMANYRELLSAENTKPPFIPFFPIIKKDLAFLHLGNKTKIDGLINIDKLRMVANEVRKVIECTSRSYTGNDMLAGLPAIGSHLVTDTAEPQHMKKAHQYFLADQSVNFYTKVFENLDKDEKTLMELSKELEPEGSASTTKFESTSATQIFSHRAGSLRRGQVSIKKAFNKYMSNK